MTHFDAFLRNVVFYVKDLYYYTTRNHKTPLECKPSSEHAIIQRRFVLCLISYCR